MSLSQNLQKIADSVDIAIDIARNKAINNINAELQYRIFNKGKAQDDSQIGTYKPSTLKTKGKKGKKNTSFVNLIDTTSLYKSIAVKDVKLSFINDYGVKVSGYNEKHFAKTIFRATKDERQIWIDTLDDEIKKLINDSGV
jgi:hypothetical protein